MIKKCICLNCEGTGKLGFQGEDCWFCEGKGFIEVEVTSEEDIRRICNYIQEVLAGTDINISDAEIINLLNSHKRV